MKKVFPNEDAMQNWLSEKLKENDSLNDLILNKEEFENQSFIGLPEKKVSESFRFCLESLSMVSIIAENENISFNPKDSLKPDFLLYAPETESIVIIELKNLAGPARQAGTEISAYINEVKSYIPFISDGDIVSVIISEEWSTLLKHYVFHEIFWQRRNLLCLQPSVETDEIGLRIIDINSLVDDVPLKLGERHLGGFQICLYDDNLYKEPHNKTRLDAYLQQIKAAMINIASKGNSQNSHGFAFLKKATWELSLAPYQITLVNFAPFQSFERHFHNLNFEPNTICKRFIDIVHEHDPMGHGNSLNSIATHATNFLKNFCSPTLEGFMLWDALKYYVERDFEDLISFHCWGIFEELYFDKILKSYQDGQTTIKFDDPGFGLEVLNEIVDSDYKFLDLNILDDEDKEDYNL